jgi:hypothetical protein
VFGVAWYDRDQWQSLRQIATDPERLEASYEDWVAMAERVIHDMEASGMLIERVPVDAERLTAWCKDEGRPVDSAARAAYVAVEIRRRHRDTAS